MCKKQYLFALLSYLLLPAVVLAGSALFILIDPEIARGHPDYVRNYRLLEQVKNACLLATVAGAAAMWFISAFFLLKSKGRAYGWLPLAALGPPGFIALSALGDKAPAPGDAYQRFVGRLAAYVRVGYELLLFVAVWAGAFAAVEAKSELEILYESATTGTPVAQVIERKNASSGMYAFGEGLEACYLAVLFYLLLPLAWNTAARLLAARAAAPRA